MRATRWCMASEDWGREELDRDCAIDPLQLDVEVTAQAETFFRWAERSIAARTSADRLKQKLDELESSLQLKVRKTPERFGLEKVTEGAISAIVTTHPDMRAMQKKVARARERAAFLEQAVRSMDMKKRMLELLVTLHGQQYFAGPTQPRNLPEQYARFRKQREHNMIARQREGTRKRRVRVRGRPE